MKTVVITGASGFIGRHLVNRLLCSGEYRIKVLSRNARSSAELGRLPLEVDVIKGDLRDPRSLEGLFEPDCIAINLVYLSNEGAAANLLSISNLLNACAAAGVKRLIHCSTADVAGRTPDGRVVESSICKPVTPYATAKLEVERAILAAEPAGYDVAILRPTAVFGPGGQNLKKLAQDLETAHPWVNALRACVFGQRRMNLVYIDNVVAAISFLIDHAHDLGKEIFIVSDDDAQANNFLGVEAALMRGLGTREPRLPRIHFPPSLLSLMLRVLRKNNVNPLCIYDSAKLRSFGFQPPVPFEEGLSRYIAWHHSASGVSQKKAQA